MRAGLRTLAGVGIACALAFTGGPVDAVEAQSATIVVPGTDRPLARGGSATPFSLRLPQAAACRGDSAKKGYRVQSFLVPAGTALDALQFGSEGPVPSGDQLRAPLYDATPAQRSFVNELTAEANPEGGVGVVLQPLPAFAFAAFDPALGFRLPPGTYAVGIACTLGPASPTQLDRYWSTEMDVRADEGDSGPAKVTWSVTGRRAAADRAGSTRMLTLLGIAAVAAVLLIARRWHTTTSTSHTAAHDM